MNRFFALLLVVASATTSLACNASYSRLELRQDSSDGYVRFDGRRNLEVGVGWSGRFRVVDTSDDPQPFDLRSADESTLEIAPVLKDPDGLDADDRAELGVVFAFLPRRAGTTNVNVVVDGIVTERISVVVSQQR